MRVVNLLDMGAGCAKGQGRDDAKARATTRMELTCAGVGILLQQQKFCFFMCARVVAGVVMVRSCFGCVRIQKPLTNPSL